MLPRTLTNFEYPEKHQAYRESLGRLGSPLVTLIFGAPALQLPVPSLRIGSAFQGTYLLHWNLVPLT